MLESVRLRADWFAYIHEFRRREFRLIFDRFPPGCFERALELGAGDGFQTGMLGPYTKRLVSTDVRRPPDQADPRIQVLALPAERLGEEFLAREFDLVYSSNMLEHVPDPPAVLKAVSEVLADDGITIHVMPNRAWKLCQLALHVPDLVATAADDLLAGRSGGGLVDRMRKFSSGPAGSAGGTEKNNPTVVRPARSVLRRVLLPEPHGVSATHRDELAAFSRSRWEAELTKAGFEVLAVLPGPFSSGYGFGAQTLARALEERGVGSEYVYVAKKAGFTCRYEGSFSPR